MLIAGEIESVKQDDSYIIYYNNNHFSTNYDTFLIVKLLQVHKNLETAYVEYLSVTDGVLTYDSFEEVSLEILKRLRQSNKNRFSNYLQFKIQLISQKNANRIGLVFKMFFSNRIIKWMAITCFAINIVNIYIVLKTQESIVAETNTLHFSKVLGYLLIFLLVSMFHEIGHISASIRFNRRCGAIGLGFYLIFPVLYADVTNAWMLPRKERLIVNLAGVYFELIISSLLILLSFILEDYMFRIIPAMSY